LIISSSFFSVLSTTQLQFLLWTKKISRCGGEAFGVGILRGGRHETQVGGLYGFASLRLDLSFACDW